MPAFGLILMSYRIVGVVVFPVVLAGGSAALAWRLQDWLFMAGNWRNGLQAEKLDQLTVPAAT